MAQRSLYDLLNGEFASGNPNLAQGVLNPDAVVARQRFVENFTGKSLDTERWTTSHNVGTGSNPMSSSGGVLVTSASGGTGNKWQIDFGAGVGMYDPAGCTMIAVYQKVVNDTASSADVFLTSDATASDPAQHILIFDEGSGVKLQLQNSGSNLTDTGLLLSSNSRRAAKIDCTGSAVNLSINGILRCVSTSNIPTSGCNPMFRVRGRGVNSNAHQMRVTYCEVYNT